MALQAATSAVFKTIFSGGASMATSPGGVAAAGVVGGGGGGGFLGWLGSIFGGGRQGGGEVHPGFSYDVGERGPERFVPAVAGRIEPAANGMGGGVTVNLDMGQTQGAANPAAALEFGRRIRAAVVDVIAQEKRPGGTLYARRNA
jgi:hypothetical protein